MTDQIAIVVETYTLIKLNDARVAWLLIIYIHQDRKVYIEEVMKITLTVKQMGI